MEKLSRISTFLLFCLFILLFKPIALAGVTVNGIVSNLSTCLAKNNDSPLGDSFFHNENYLLSNALTTNIEFKHDLFHSDIDLTAYQLLNRGKSVVLDSLTYSINDLYIELPLGKNIITAIGKKRIVWGTGFSYNPINFVSLPKLITDVTTGEKRGLPLIDINVYKGKLSLEGVMLMRNEPKNIEFAGKITSFAMVPNTDIHIAGFYSKDQKSGYGIAVSSTPFTSWLSGLAINSEIATVNSKEIDSNTITGGRMYTHALEGLCYTAEFTTAVVEYFLIEDGVSVNEILNVSSANPMAGLSMYSSRPAKHNVLVYIYQSNLTQRTNPFTDEMFASFTGLGNPQDRSLYAEVSLGSKMIQNCELELKAGHFFGKGSNQYNVTPYKSIFSFEARVGY